MLGDRRFHVLLVAQHSQLFEQLALLAVEFGGSEHVDMDVQVTAAGAFLHTIARGRPALLAVGGATAALGAIAAMYLGVLVTTNVA